MLLRQKFAAPPFGHRLEKALAPSGRRWKAEVYTQHPIYQPSDARSPEYFPPKTYKHSSKHSYIQQTVPDKMPGDITDAVAGPVPSNFDAANADNLEDVRCPAHSQLHLRSYLTVVPLHRLRSSLRSRPSSICKHTGPSSRRSKARPCA